MNEILEKIGRLGIVPVVKIEDSKDAIPLGKALLEGELPIAEITFRTAAAEDSIKALTDELPELLVGAGTVLTIEQAKKAVEAGARFIVSPGFNSKIVDYCLENNIVVTPGVNNPTQIEMALEKGLEIVKFFPAQEVLTRITFYHILPISRYMLAVVVGWLNLNLSLQEILRKSQPFPRKLFPFY